MTVVVGVDVGTSAIKAVVVDAQSGVQIGMARTLTPWQTRGSAVETTVSDISRAVLESIRGALGKSGVRSVSAIGVTGIAESGVLVDSRGVAASPVIAWHDARGAEQFDVLLAGFGMDFLALSTGQLITPRLTAAKVKYLRDAGSEGVRWLSVPELVVEAFGGSARPDLSQWSRTGLLDIQSGVVLADVCEWVGLVPEAQRTPVFSGTPMGSVASTVDLDAIRGAVLTTAGHDHVCAALGAGVIDSTQVCDSWGNGEALVRPVTALPDIAVALEAACSTSWGLYQSHVLFTGLGTGLILRQILDQLDIDDSRRDELDRLAASDDLSVPSHALVWRDALDAAFSRVQDGVDRLVSVGGAIDAVIGCGGWLRSEPIARRKTSRVRGFRVTGQNEPAAGGAALLAIRAAKSA
jgi:sugar (pentulose or hexulose) kinase